MKVVNNLTDLKDSASAVVSIRRDLLSLAGMVLYF